MIWTKIKNGFSRLRAFLGLTSVLILSLFFSFYSSSSASAISLTNQTYQLYYLPDRFTSTNTFDFSSTRSQFYNYTQIYNQSTWPNCTDFDCYNSNSWRFLATAGTSRLLLTYNNVNITNNSASIHFEFNIVVTGTHDAVDFGFQNLDKLVFRYSDKVRTFSSISYATTDWRTSICNGTNPIDCRWQDFKTLTIYADASLTGLATGSGSLYFEIGTRDDSPFIVSFPDYWRPNGSFPYAVFGEQNPTDISFYATQNEALNQTQINIMNNQYELQQTIYNQDQEDRSNIQNVSENANQDGSDATDSAENATSSLLGAITSIYDQLLHPTTSNCIIEGVQVYEMNLGNLDFCTGFTIPQPIFAIGALIMVGLIILLAWSILKAGMSLYNSLLGGKD